MYGEDKATKLIILGMYRNTLFGVILFLMLFLSVGCRSVYFLFWDINYKIPKVEFMRANYVSNRMLYDSIFVFSDLLINSNTAQKNCMEDVQIFDDGSYNMSFDYRRCAEYGGCNNPLRDSVSRSHDLGLLRNKITNSQNALKAPRYIFINQKIVVVHYKLVKETFKDRIYVEYYFTKNKPEPDWDSVATNVYTNVSSLRKE